MPLSHTLQGRRGGKEVWLCQWGSNLAKQSGSALGSEWVSPEFQKLPWTAGKDSTRPRCSEGRTIALESPSPLFFYRFLHVLPLDWEAEAAAEREPSACLPCCWQSFEHCLKQVVSVEPC